MPILLLVLWCYYMITYSIFFMLITYCNIIFHYAMIWLHMVYLFEWLLLVILFWFWLLLVLFKIFRTSKCKWFAIAITNQSAWVALTYSFKADLHSIIYLFLISIDIFLSFYKDNTIQNMHISMNNHKYYCITMHKLTVNYHTWYLPILW